MRKIGIVTIISYNLGNRLQNYALQECLRSFEQEVVTIPFYENTPKINRWKFIVKDILAPLKPCYYKVCWERFNARIKWHTCTVNSPHFCRNEFSYFVAGSDQIWNPDFEFNSDREFLTFAKSDQKISYAASIGKSSLSELQKNRFSNLLQDFKAISVREDDAARIVQESIGREVQVVLDPTMMLSAEKWRKVAKQSRFHVKKPYVLKYFLGSDRNIATEQAIEEYAKSQGAKIVDITSSDERTMNRIGPSEFISLIDNCYCFFTDSFHGVVFSVLLRKPFIVYDRLGNDIDTNMSSRMDTLLSRFNLLNQRYKKTDVIVEDMLHWDYDDVQEMLNKEIRRSYEYLQNSLK